MFSELPVVSVHIPPVLRGVVGGLAEVMGSGETVGEVFEALASRYPQWRAHILKPDGDLADGVAVYLGATSIRDLSGLATPVGGEESINVLHAASSIEALPLAALKPAVAHDISIGD